METNRGRGRPPKPEGERRSETIRVPLTTKEKAIIDLAAERSARATSAWARLALLKLAKEKWKP